MTEPAVTVVCATLNAREAVRLTFASFRRYTPEACIVLVADNGSTDGTLDDLRALPWVRVIPLEERMAECLIAGGQSQAGALTPALLTRHGVTLDWLARQVTTPFFLTLDSDVEFMAGGWLSAMVAFAMQEELVALGVYEPGMAGYRPRLAPYVLLMRTAPFRSLGLSFQSFVRIEDPAEAARWRARGHSFQVADQELASYHSASFYATGAALFERLEQTDARWAALSDDIADRFRHLGHMSWAADTAGDVPGAADLHTDHDAKLAYVRARLRQYDGLSTSGMRP